VKTHRGEILLALSMAGVAVSIALADAKTGDIGLAQVVERCAIGTA
jgi:hypothetical protein